METKKSNRANLEKKRSMFFQVGLLLALSFTFVAFEWQVATRMDNVVWEAVVPAVIEFFTPRTAPPEIPPPAPQHPGFELEIVDNEVILDDIPDIVIDFENGMNLLPDVFTETARTEDPEPDIFDLGLVEQEPLFNGKSPGDAFRSYIGQNLMYPSIAAGNGVAGRVFVQFVIDQTGDVVDVRIMRGVDPSLDNEAMRLIKSTSGMWTAGKQRGKAVKVRYVFSINFRLQ